MHFSCNGRSLRGSSSHQTNVLGRSGAADLYLGEIFKHHGLSDDEIVSDTLHFTVLARVVQAVGGEVGRGHYFFLSSDTAEERSHKVLERMPRSITWHPQSKWHDPQQAEFAINGAVRLALGTHPFAVDLGQHPANLATLLTHDKASSFPI